MNDKMLFIVIFSGIWCGIGIIFAFVAAILHSVRKKRQISCSQKAVGTVTDVVRSRSSSPHHHYWHPVIQFTTALGQTITHRYPYGTNPPKFHVGQTVHLCYNPQNPQQFYLPDDKLAKTLAWIFTFVAIALIAVGAVVGILVWFLWN